MLSALIASVYVQRNDLKSVSKADGTPNRFEICIRIECSSIIIRFWMLDQNQILVILNVSESNSLYLIGVLP